VIYRIFFRSENMISTKLKSMLAVAFLVGGVSAANAAGSTGAAVNVLATVTPSCSTSVTAGTAIAYTGMTNAAVTAASMGSVTFTCTRGLTLTGVAWDGASTGGGSGDTATATTTGTVAGLAYTLKSGAATKTAGAAASGSTGAGATTYVYALTVDMAANQPGDSGASGTAARTLTLSY
jgi:hypothetical protein